MARCHDNPPHAADRATVAAGCRPLATRSSKPTIFNGLLDDSVVALKILKSASLAQLQREVDALAAVEHPGIVKMISYGKLSSDQTYLAMECLLGPTLRHYCTRATRLDAASADDVLRQLLDALVALHPDQKRVNELRTRQHLSVDEFKQLEVAMHGYVHRDIKPDNVILVPNRGPVLIDFGISSRVSTGVRTLSGTPGYLPPDGVDVRWSPDVDLYQLGLTMAQAICGVAFDPENPDELRTMLASDDLGRVQVVVQKLCAPTRVERYDSARSALDALVYSAPK